MLKQSTLGDGAYIVYKITATPQAEPWIESDYSWTVVETDSSSAPSSETGDPAPTGTQSLTVNLLHSSSRTPLTNAEITVTHVNTGAVHIQDFGSVAISDLVHGDQYTIEVSPTTMLGSVTYSFFGWEEDVGGVFTSANPFSFEAGVTELSRGTTTQLIGTYA